MVSFTNLLLFTFLSTLLLVVTATDYSSCSANAGCSGLIGNCCPSDTGVDLSCCDSTEVESDAACVANDACSAIGLTGLCCPTAEGVSLECCEGSSTDSTAKECSAHAACSGLIGNCCPTDDGSTLDCKFFLSFSPV